MGFFRQAWTLTRKNLLINFQRHWLSTTIVAFLAPLIYMFFISYAKNFFVPPSAFGIASPSPLRSLGEALQAADSTHSTVAFVHNGFSGGEIGQVIDSVAETVRRSGKTAKVLSDANELVRTCPSSLRGVSNCFAAAVFHSSPTQGPHSKWNYTIRGDGTFGNQIYVDRDDNDAEIYILPFQHAIDSAIAATNGSSLPQHINQYPYTDRTQEQRNRLITRLYQGSLIDFLALVYFIGVVGITYQLVGHMATERELGMSQLIEAMMPNKRRWEPQAARMLAYHLAFDIIYLPGWILMGAIVQSLVFPDTNVGILIGLQILIGLALSSYSLLFGSFFHKAQLSGITTVIMSIVFAIIAQLGVGSDASTATVAVLSLLFPPISYTFFMIWLASFQEKERSADLSQAAPERPWEIAGYVFWLFLIIQILVFPVIAAIVERSLYGTASTDRKVRHNSDTVSPVSVKLSNFSKHYRQGWFKGILLTCCGRKRKDQVVAVKDLTLNILQGQIMTLLGANGSGKSTTLDAIAGLNRITKGEIELDGTGGLGLCPQKNVLWDELTCLEHAMIFNKLKTIDGEATKSETCELLSACDLDVKVNAKAKTLSGGQKRKLQLAMMFTGGSRVCCVDEVSSGIDPLARRKVWDILLSERGRRTILLTTHFLDEADVLSDHIAILSKGSLKAEGSAAELKHKLGSGYRVSVENSCNFQPDQSFSSVRRFVDYDHTVYHLTDARQVSDFLAQLDRQNIQEYRVQGPSVEDVFLKLAEEIREDFETNHSSKSLPVSDDSDDADAFPESRLKDKPMDLLPGHGTGLFKQSWTLFRKRFTVLRHNALPYLSALTIPIAAAGLVTLFLKGQKKLGCSPGQQSSASDAQNFASLISPDFVYGPPSLIPVEAIFRIYPFLNASSVHTVDTLAEFNDYIANNYRKVLPGGVFIDRGTTPTFAYVGNFVAGASVLVQSLLNNVLSETRIFTIYQPLATPFTPQAGNTLQFILYFGLAMSAYTGFFALYPTAERVRKVRALHYSNGVRSGPLWVAYATFDFIFVLVISLVAIGLFLSQWDGYYYPGYLFVVFFLYGLASTGFAYAISLFTPSQLAAYAFTAGAQASLFLIYFIAYMCIITYAPVTLTTSWLNYATYTINLITPSGNLLRALLLTFNEFSNLCDDHAVRAYGGDILAFGGPILYLSVQFFLLMTFVIWWDSGGRISFRRSRRRPESDDEKREFQGTEVTEELKRVETSNDGLRVLHLTKIFGINVAVEDITFGITKGETFALLGPNGAGKSTTISLIRGDLRPSSKESEVFVEGNSILKRRIAARNHLGVCPQFDAMDKMTVRGHLRFYARVRGVADIDHNVKEVMRSVGLQMYADRMADKLSGGNKRKLSLAIALMGNPAVLLLDEPSSGMDAAAKRVMWRVLGSITHGRALLITTHSMEEADALAERAGIMARNMLALGTTDSLRRKHGDAYHVHLVHQDAPHTSNEEMERIKQWVLDHIPNVMLETRTYHGQLRFSVPNKFGESLLDTSSESSKGDPSDESITKAAAVQVHGNSGRGQQGINALFSLLETNKEELRFAYYSVQPTTLDQVFLNVVNKHNVEEENYKRQEQGKKKSMGKVITDACRKIISDA